MRPPRTGSSTRDAAEAAFRSATTKPVTLVESRKVALPNAKELVTLRLDRDVMEHFQSGGAGWQERLNAALRTAAGL